MFHPTYELSDFLVWLRKFATNLENLIKAFSYKLDTQSSFEIPAILINIFKQTKKGFEKQQQKSTWQHLCKAAFTSGISYTRVGPRARR